MDEQIPFTQITGRSRAEPAALVAIVGAESTGKSTLAQALAQKLRARWLPEVLRDFCDRWQRPPTRQEQAGIVAAQMAAEQGLLAACIVPAAHAMKTVIVDSTPLMTALYSSEYFADESLLAAAIAHQHRYALTLVTGDEIAWEADGIQRDGPQVRDRCQRRLLACLTEQAIAFTLLRGDRQTRLATALALVRAAGLS